MSFNLPEKDHVVGYELDKSWYVYTYEYVVANIFKDTIWN